MPTPDRDRAAQRQGTRRDAVGVVGLGIMGSAMSANLVKAGFEVLGYDPVSAARERLRKAGGTACARLDALAGRCRRLVLSLPSDEALLEVATALATHAAAGTIVAETSTLSAGAKRTAHDVLAARAVALLDCPLSGTGAQAKTRDLIVYASGDPASIADFAPVFEAIARQRYDVGVFGNGSRLKLVANLLVAIHNVSAAEALLMGRRLGLEPATLLRALADGAGGSRMLEVRGPMMQSRAWDHATMKVQTWQKDMRLIQEALADSETPAPLFAACVPIYNAAMALGHGDDDTAAVYGVLEHMTRAGEAELSAPGVPAKRIRSARSTSTRRARKV